MVFETAGSDVAFLLARVLFGGILAFMGLNHFANAESMVPYAEAKGLPAPRFAVLGSGALLVLGGLSIVTGIYPAVGAGAIAVFLLVTTPVMHDFWAAPEEQQQSEMTNFLKNVAMLGGALAFVALAGVEWPYAVSIGLF